ncbi:MAG: TolC family protein, partial [Muribaculaceae bacterium]|nr:TolC family protein [Muribaculaceae bacterium]
MRYQTKLIRTIVPLSLCIAAGTSVVSAQVVTLDSCRHLALRNNKTIRMAEEALRGAGYDRKAAFAAYLPGIDFTGGYMHNQQRIE